MVGAYLYFPLILKATSMIHFLGLVDKTTGEQIGLQIIYTGIAVAMFLALVQKRLKGIGEATTLIQVFADVLSYLRLYALGLPERSWPRPSMKSARLSGFSWGFW